MSKVLITGGAGFIGSTLAKSLINHGDQVTVIDDLSMGQRANLPATGFTFIQGSVTNQALIQRILTETTFDYVYLLAAIASVADSVARPLVTHEVNQEANLFILETLRTLQQNPKRVVFTSSAAVYGDEPTLPKRETAVVKPLTPYAIDKFAVERFLLAYGALYGLNASVVRFFNVYGPHQNPSSPYSGVLSILADHLKTGEAFTVFGDGEQTRDFVFVEDVVAALQLVATSEASLQRVFNVATGMAVSLNQIIDLFQTVADTKIPIHYEPSRAGDIRDSVADVQALKSLGFMPKFSLNAGLRAYWQSLS